MGLNSPKTFSGLVGSSENVRVDETTGIIHIHAEAGGKLPTTPDRSWEKLLVEDLVKGCAAHAGLLSKDELKLVKGLGHCAQSSACRALLSMVDVRIDRNEGDFRITFDGQRLLVTPDALASSD